MNRRTILQALAIGALVIATLACGGGGKTTNSPFQFWTETPNATQTPIVMFQEITTTPNATQTPNVVILTQTPNALVTLCVSANVAVYLRPSPNDDNYPILPLPNGSELSDLGGRSGKWLFVSYKDNQGWVLGDFLGNCQ